jgi:nicotinate-nucleotide adenylyltransferase
MRIGLMGGTFDPVHYGHLAIAEMAREAFALERVIWIPAGDPPHKPGRVTTPQEHRYAMVLLATATHPQFEVSRMELERDGPSYTLYTLQEMHRRLPDAELFFIMGADTVLDLLTWYRHEEVVESCRLVAVTRPGYDLERLREVLPAHYVKRVDPLEAPGVQVSSTALRERLRSGHTVRYLVPEEVEAYLRKHHLYREDGSHPGAE